MELRPGYKQTEAGVIPEDWGTYELGEICSFENGDRSSNYPSQNDFVSSGIPFVNAGHVSGGRIDCSQLDFIKPEIYARLTRGKVKEGDILYCLRGSLGKFGVVTKEFGDGAIASSLVIVRVKPKTSTTPYLLCYFGSSLCSKMIETWAGGAAQPNLGVQDLARFLVPVPPAQSEQEGIAEALSDADALIESVEKLLAKKRQIKQGAMQALLTGKQRLPGFSGKWETKSLGDLFSFSGGFSASRDQLSSEGHCYLHYGDIHTSDKTFIDVRADFQNIPKLDVPLKRIAPTAFLDDGDVVFVDASEDDEGTSRHFVVANLDRRPFISGLHTIVAKSKTAELDHLYRRYCFQTWAVKSQFRFFAVGTKVSGISKTNIVKIAIPVPSLEEQVAIAAILSAMDAELAALESRLTKAHQLKQGMMQALLTGRIRLI